MSYVRQKKKKEKRNKENIHYHVYIDENLLTIQLWSHLEGIEQTILFTKKKILVLIGMTIFAGIVSHWSDP